MRRVSGVEVGETGGRVGVGEAIEVPAGRSVGLTIERAVGLASAAAGEFESFPQAARSTAAHSKPSTRANRHDRVLMFMLPGIYSRKVVAIIA
jgi:hypothetical protein